MAPVQAAVDCLVITGQPESVSACPEDSARFTLTARGVGALTYQWRKDTFPLFGENLAYLLIPMLSFDDYGSYSCVVTNRCGSLTSQTVTLSAGNEPVAIDQQPSAATVCSGSSATFTVRARGENLSYQWRFEGQKIEGANTNELFLSAVYSADLGRYDCVVSNPCASLTSRSASLLIARDGHVISQPEDAHPCPNATVSFTVQTSGPAPKKYQWYKDGSFHVGSNQATLQLYEVDASDEGKYNSHITQGCTTLQSQPARLTLKKPITLLRQPMDVAVCRAEPVSFCINARGSLPLSYQWYRKGQPISGAAGTCISIVTTPETTGTYSCQVKNSCGTITSTEAVLTLIAAPSIQQQPTDVLACPGEPVSISIAMTDSGPYTYQWRKDCAPLPGETSPTLHIPAVRKADAGSYVCVASDGCRSVSSTSAALHLAESCASSIPDPKLRAFLLTTCWHDAQGTPYAIDRNNDLMISKEEALAVRGALDCHRTDFTDLAGLGVFPNLTRLICAKNHLTTLPAKLLDLAELAP